jgi:hypothetical protein
VCHKAKLEGGRSKVNEIMISMYNRSMQQDLITTFIQSGKFTAQELVITTQMAEDWVQFRSDPKRFLPAIFDGDWARADRKPNAGPIKVVRVMCGNDGVFRLIGRQGSNIYATPWIGE